MPTESYFLPGIRRQTGCEDAESRGDDTGNDKVGDVVERPSPDPYTECDVGIFLVTARVLLHVPCRLQLCAQLSLTIHIQILTRATIVLLLLL